jgi:hypothetical protein
MIRKSVGAHSVTFGVLGLLRRPEQSTRPHGRPPARSYHSPVVILPRENETHTVRRPAIPARTGRTPLVASRVVPK